MTNTLKKLIIDLAIYTANDYQRNTKDYLTDDHKEIDRKDIKSVEINFNQKGLFIDFTLHFKNNWFSSCGIKMADLLRFTAIRFYGSQQLRIETEICNLFNVK